LLSCNVGHHVTPLLQVNMQILWQACSRGDGVIEFTHSAITSLIGSHEALLDHYLQRVRERVTTTRADDYRILEILNFYVEEAPISALKTEWEYGERFKDDSFAQELRNSCEYFYLLYRKGAGDSAITRLTHDSLARSVFERYSKLTTEKVQSRGLIAFESLRNELEEQIYSLR
ncbi:MAG: hypothetical protein KDD60_11435, partial [Bdellovibrionales bacterium]|nr:hypothetical protein [Bdellovibrionales bacterium]